MTATRLESLAKLILPLALALVVAAGLYVFGTEHVPDYSGTALFGRTATDTLSLKSWLATGLLALAGLQLGLALWMYGKLGIRSGITLYRVTGGKVDDGTFIPLEP